MQVMQTMIQSQNKKIYKGRLQITSKKCFGAFLYFICSKIFVNVGEKNLASGHISRADLN